MIENSVDLIVIIFNNSDSASTKKIKKLVDTFCNNDIIKPEESLILSPPNVPNYSDNRTNFHQIGKIIQKKLGKDCAYQEDERVIWEQLARENRIITQNKLINQLQHDNGYRYIFLVASPRVAINIANIWIQQTKKTEVIEWFNRNLYLQRTFFLPNLPDKTFNSKLKNGWALWAKKPKNTGDLPVDSFNNVLSDCCKFPAHINALSI